VRHYELLAEPETITALRMLREPWAHYSASDQQVDVRLVTGAVVRIDVDGRDLERRLECFRIRARSVGHHRMRAQDSLFGAGLARIALLRGEEWITAPDGTEGPTIGTVANVQDSGRPGSRPWLALAACSVDDAVLFENADGLQLVVRCAVMPCTLSVLVDSDVVTQFVAERESIELLQADV
jgi:hypothetical protein